MTNRKIIHIDADAFYASVEMRERPELANQAIAVGGRPEGRGVIATCNYTARKFGVRSAMSSAHALRLCPDLVFIAPNFALYKQVSKQMHEIFQRFTEEIEPLSLDEAYLDVSECSLYQGSATRIAHAIRDAIKRELRLSVSAGIAPNKFLAKIASDWNKPDGQFVIPPSEVDTFVRALPVNKINGVGKVTTQKLKALGIETCQDIRDSDPQQLIKRFGKQGHRLIALSYGLDDRPVQVSRIRKSLSVEHTYDADLNSRDGLIAKLPALLEELDQRLKKSGTKAPIHKRFVKVKFNDFSQTTLEQMISEGKHYASTQEWYEAMLLEAWDRRKLPARLLGLGVRFDQSHHKTMGAQLDLFESKAKG